MAIKTRQNKQSVINEMTKDDNKDKTIKQSVINEMTKNDNEERTIQTIS